jgi:single-strand DNA-binding protein
MGNLGRDPELRYTPQGIAVCDFSVAVNEKKRDKAGELQDTTTWFKVTLWRNQAEIASKYLTKGSPVYIEGRLSLGEWTDREGNNRYSLEVTATDMHFVGGGNRPDETENQSDQSGGGTAEYSGGSSRESETSFQTSSPQQANDDDIPF